jgi:hypothetical protein
MLVMLPFEYRKAVCQNAARLISFANDFSRGVYTASESKRLAAINGDVFTVDRPRREITRDRSIKGVHGEVDTLNRVLKWNVVIG